MQYIKGAANAVANFLRATAHQPDPRERHRRNIYDDLTNFSSIQF